MSELPQAREILVEAMGRGHYQVWNASGELDLHLASSERSSACTAAEARVILYHTLLEFAEGSRNISDLVVITGQGHGSSSAGPVLPTVTRAFLREDMDPSLDVEEVANNPGRFIVPGASIQRWVSHSN